MKIGRYPVKRKYSVPRLLSDIVSAVILFIITYLAFVFIDECNTVYSYAEVENERLNLVQSLKYLAFVPVILAFAVTIFTVVFVLVSKKAPKKYSLTVKTAQQYYIILADAVSLVRVPILLALFEVSYYVQNIIIGFEVSYFSIQFVCDILLAVIIIRFTMHRFAKLCSGKSASTSVSDNPVIKEIEAKNAEKEITDIKADEKKGD